MMNIPDNQRNIEENIKNKLYLNFLEIYTIL